MISFEEVMTITRTIDTDLVFSDEEAQAYYDLLVSLPDKSTIMEIGLQYGRSSSIALQIVWKRHFTYYGIDPFTETPQAEEEWEKVVKQIEKQSLPDGFEEDYQRCRTIKCRSDEVQDWPYPVHLALIDGDHTTEGVTTDCRLVMPLIASGGYICLHDYNRSHLPGVKWAAEATLGQSAEWKMESVSGTLAVWRKS